MSTPRIFITGVYHGRKYKIRQTPREVSMLFPSWGHHEITIFLNGQEDGIANDRFRLNLVKAKEKGQ